MEEDERKKIKQKKSKRSERRKRKRRGKIEVFKGKDEGEKYI